MVDAAVFQLDDGFFTGNRLDLATQLVPETIAVVAHGFENKIQSPVFHGFQGAFSAAFRERTDHQHRHGVRFHKFLKGRQAVKTRHFHIQSHDVGVQLSGFLQSLLAVACRTGHFDFRILLQEGNQGMAHES